MTSVPVPVKILIELSEREIQSEYRRIARVEIQLKKSKAALALFEDHVKKMKEDYKS